MQTIHFHRFFTCCWFAYMENRAWTRLMTSFLDVPGTKNRACWIQLRFYKPFPLIELCGRFWSLSSKSKMFNNLLLPSSSAIWEKRHLEFFSRLRWCYGALSLFLFPLLIKVSCAERCMWKIVGDLSGLATYYTHPMTPGVTLCMVQSAVHALSRKRGLWK